MVHRCELEKVLHSMGIEAVDYMRDTRRHNSVHLDFCPAEMLAVEGL
jgi:hypothetical protein